MNTATTSAPAPGWDSARRQVADGLLSIIMPAYNLAPVIGANIRAVHALFKGQLPFEIVAVDDGSADGTRRCLEDLAREFPELRPVCLAQNMGKGAALKHGFDASRGTFVLFLDGDLDLPPDQVPGFFNVMEEKRADVVIGSKLHPDSVVQSYPWHRKLASAVYYSIVKTLVGLPVRDTQTGIKLFRRKVLDYVFPRMLVKKFAFDIELLAIAGEKGFRIADSPVVLTAQARWPVVRPRAVIQTFTDTLAIFYRLRLLRYYQSLPDMAPPSPELLVSIVVACPAPSAYLEECLHGIGLQTYTRYEVLILPDAPSGRAWPPAVREIPTGRIRPAEKRNRGIRESRGALVAFLDDDAFPVEGWLKQAIVHFTDPRTAAVGGPATTPPGDPYLAQLGGYVYANRLVSGQYRYRYEAERVRDVDDYPSCNLIVRREVLEKVGGFRTDFWPGEDTYLCLDIVKTLKLRIVYDPRVHVFHHRRKLFLPHLRQIGRYGLHRGYFARRFPETSRRLSYMMPSLFVIGLVLGGLLSLFWPPIRALYLAAVVVYLAAVLLSCVGLFFIRLNPATWLLTAAGIILTHITYGSRFLAGLFTRRLPGEVQRFDHPSEIPPPSR